MSSPKPIHIIGGGLAGLSLGIALRKAGVPTEIFEAGDYPRHRVCGEFIAGLDGETIDKLGIAPAFEGAGSPATVTWFWRGQRVRRQHLPSPARAISRFALDARLAWLFVAGGGKLTRLTRASPPGDRSGWVQTSGRKPAGSSRWVGLKLHARGLNITNGLEVHLGDGAYVGLSAVEGDWVNVCGLFRRRHGLRMDREQALSTYLRACGLLSLAERVAAARIRPDSTCAVAGFSFSRKIMDGDGLNLGDACAMIPPFTGNGMAMAFTGAALAVDPLVAWANGGRSWTDTERAIRNALRQTFRRRLSGAALIHPFLLSRPLQRCLATAAHANLLPLASMYRLLH